MLPGKILRKWDFSKSYVSNFARDLLAKIAGDPLFNLHDINTSLYKKMKALDTVRVSMCFNITKTLSVAQLYIEKDSQHYKKVSLLTIIHTFICSVAGIKRTAKPHEESLENLSSG